MRQASNGFTLLELLVILAIIGLLASLVAPDSLATLTRSQRYVELRKLETLLGYAAERAFIQAKPTFFALEGQQVTVFTQDETGYTAEFELLHFPPQQIAFTATGYVNKPTLSYSISNNTAQLEHLSLGCDTPYVLCANN